MTIKRIVRTVLFSTLYPSSVRPGHGIFVETRLRELLTSGLIETKVVAPVPWFFSSNPRFGDYARMAATPAREMYHGVDVLHPRYILPPSVGMNIAPLTLALGALGAMKRLQNEGFEFDVIDAHYYYPDGVAAALLAKYFKKPFTVTARGSDLSLIPQFTFPRRMIKWAASRANASIGVCMALMDVLREMNIDPHLLHVMRNGVDLQRFRPVPRKETCSQLGLLGYPILLSVGNLVELKGHHIAIEALACLLPEYPQARLVIVGEGVELDSLKRICVKLKIENCVKFIGRVPNDGLYQWYGAADLLILASSREGWANVLLESLACGTPVVATRIWGTPEVVADPVAGNLVDERTGDAFADSIRQLLGRAIDRSLIRAYAENFSWNSTTQAQVALFNALAKQAESSKNA